MSIADERLLRFVRHARHRSFDGWRVLNLLGDDVGQVVRVVEFDLCDNVVVARDDVRRGYLLDFGDFARGVQYGRRFGANVNEFVSYGILCRTTTRTVVFAAECFSVASRR
nr:hypothetical protein [Haladaptatus pallidirubidus]